MPPDPPDDHDADAVANPTEGQRAIRAVLLGAGLGAVLTLLARRVSP